MEPVGFEPYLNGHAKSIRHLGTCDPLIRTKICQISLDLRGPKYKVLFMGLPTLGI